MASFTACRAWFLLGAAVATSAAWAGAPAVSRRPVARYGLVEMLRSLECVEEWAQLCSVPMGLAHGLGLDLAVYDDVIEISPYSSDVFVFKILMRRGSEYWLALEPSCLLSEELSRAVVGKKVATLSIDGGGHAVYVGPDPFLLQDGKVVERRMRLVLNEAIVRRQEELVQKYVPGGRCEAVYGYRLTGRRSCINRMPDDGVDGGYVRLPQKSPFACPSQIHVSERWEDESEGWTDARLNIPRRFDRLTVFAGRPVERASLVPDESVEMRNGNERSIWRLVPIGRPYWMQCEYDGTRVVIQREVGAAMSRCWIEVNPKVHHNFRPQVISAACE